MKLAVLSTCGTVGKTTLVAHLFAPQMPGVKIIAIESINETVGSLGTQVSKIAGDHYRDIYGEIALLDDGILDIGASNIEQFLLGMARYAGSHTEYDRYIIPVTSGTKEMTETIQLIRTLAAYGIAATKIRIIFNRVKENVAVEFSPLISFATKEKLCIADQEAAVPENEIYNLLAAKHLSIADVLADSTDYRARAREIPDNGDIKLRRHYIDMMGMQALAKTAKHELDKAYAALFDKKETIND
jgi:hypothetical protein